MHGQMRKSRVHVEKKYDIKMQPSHLLNVVKYSGLKMRISTSSNMETISFAKVLGLRS